MRPSRHYSKLKLVLILGACMVVGGLVAGSLTLWTGVDLFAVYGGLPGFLCIAVVVSAALWTVRALDAWLTDSHRR